MNKTMGTLKVDFADTREEATAFVKQHGNAVPLHVGNKPNIGNEGLPQLTVRYVSSIQRDNYVRTLAALGWEGCVIAVPTGV